MQRGYRDRAVGVLVVLGIWLGSAASAASAQRQGFEAGVRLGYGVPLGEATDSGDLDASIEGQIPLWFDIGYRANAHFFVGLYAQYGFGFLGDTIEAACNAGELVVEVDCWATDLRLGVQAHYHISPREFVDPWLGVGIGYEWLTIGIEVPGNDASFTLSGLELVNLQFGLDVHAANHFYLGPFASFSLGRFSELSADCSGPVTTCAPDITLGDTSLHEWLVFGVRATYAP